MKKTILLFIQLLFISSLSFSQNTTNLEGKVIDQNDRPISNASILILNSNLGAVTDANGTFEIQNIPVGKYEMHISAIGFASVNKEILTSQNTRLQIQMNPSSVHLDEVIVSAQKREETLQKLPFSISSLSSNQVTQYRLWDNNDLTGIIPNLNSNNSGDGRNVTSIRGIATTSYTPAIATYIDGVNQFDLDTYIPYLFDVDRIEVLRGPQGTLYGRSAMGGVINIITKKPTNETRAYAELNFGNYGQQRYNVALRTPLIKDKLFLGIAGVYQKSNGYYTNDFNDSHYDKQHNILGNYYLKYLASPRWDLTLNVKHNNNRNHGAFPLSMDKSAGYHLNQNAIAEMDDNTLNASLAAKYAGAAFNFTSTTAYQSNKRIYLQPIDGDFSPIDGITIINDYGGNWNKVEVLTQEFRFSSPADISSKWNWTSGIYFYYQHDPDKQATHFGEQGTMMGAQDNNSAVLTTSVGKNYGTAIYGQSTYNLSDELQLTGGIRYDYEHLHQSALSQYLIDGIADPVFDIQPDTTGKAGFSAFSPKVSLNYQLSDNNTLYATYSRGFRSGGLTEISSDPSEPPLEKFKPEYSNNYEVGTKNEFWNGRMRLNAAVFYNLVNHAQVPILILPDAFTTTRNAGRMRSHGAEVEFKATPAKGLFIDYNFGYTNARFINNSILKKDGSGNEVNMKDKWQIFTPKTTSSLAVQYGIDVVPQRGIKAVVRGEWIHLGKQYFDLANTISQSAYSKFNTRIGIEAKNYGLYFWGRNLGDKRYVAYAYDFGAAHLGNPRTYGVSVVVKR